MCDGVCLKGKLASLFSPAGCCDVVASSDADSGVSIQGARDVEGCQQRKDNWPVLRDDTLVMLVIIHEEVGPGSILLAILLIISNIADNIAGNIAGNTVYYSAILLIIQQYC